MKFNTTALEFWHSRQGQNPSLLVFILEDVKIVFQHKYCRSFNIYIAIQDKQTYGNKVQIIPSKVTFSFCITNPKMVSRFPPLTIQPEKRLGHWGRVRYRLKANWKTNRCKQYQRLSPFNNLYSLSTVLS